MPSVPISAKTSKRWPSGWLGSGLRGRGGTVHGQQEVLGGCTAAGRPAQPRRRDPFRADNSLSPDDQPDYPREPDYLLLARVLLAQERPGQALALLDRLDAVAAAQDRTGSLIEIGALRALALAASGQETAAVDALAGAPTLARPQGYVRVFADEGPPMAALLAG